MELARRKDDGKILEVVKWGLGEVCVLEDFDYSSPNGSILKTHRQWHMASRYEKLGSFELSTDTLKKLKE